MKKNFDVEIVDLNGVVQLNEGQPITCKQIIVGALMTSFANENISGEEKMKRFKLAERINVGGEVEVADTETVLIKELVSKGYGTLAVGRIYDIIDKDIPVRKH